MTRCEEVEAELERVKRNMLALGAAWQHHWGDFDGRQLRKQIGEILEEGEGGVDFYHDHITVEFWDKSEKCPKEYVCKTCREIG